jgi:hypothetical protein
MLPFGNFQFRKQSEGVLRITFDYTKVVRGYDHVVVLLVEEDGGRDNWSLKPRNYTIPRYGIGSTRLAFYNESYNDWLTIPTNTTGDRDDHGRRLFLKTLPQPLGSSEIVINAYYNPSQPDRGSSLEFYAIVGIVSEANGHPVSLLGDYHITSTLRNV